MPDIALVLMPLAATERPSIALGILQAAARAQNLDCRSYYANLWYAEQVGLGVAKRVSTERFEALVGEWIFAQAAFPDHPVEASHYFSLVPRGEDPEFVALVGSLRSQAGAFITEAARRILADNPRVVGCSSMFHQHCASLALLRTIKRLRPEVITMLGGANCEGDMGRATHRNFPWVDYVVSGEAEAVFPELCRSLLAGAGEIDLPGVFAPVHREQGTGPGIERLVVERLDESPIPDYDDYFEQLQTSSLREAIRPGLLIETSRGCWWGQKHHCTFCGLNGTGMNYRSKSPGRALDEFRTLAERYQLRNFEVVDNIIDLSHIRTVLPELARDGGYTLFYETKANLRYEQLQQLVAAGVYWLQPGIESMHDEILKLMDKGTSAIINTQLLKWGRELGVYVSWNFLLAFPGEQEHWYTEMMEWLPLIWHLQPPTGVPIVRYDRFSPYFYRPEAYGLELTPCETYSCIYPVDAEQLAHLAYFFEDQSYLVRRRGDLAKRPEVLEFIGFIKQWRERFLAPMPPVLSADDDGECLDIIDTRPCAVQSRHKLRGLARRVYLACEAARPVGKILEDVPEAEVAEAVAQLVQARLLLVLGGRALALAVRGSLPFLPKVSQYPGGYARV